MEQINSLLEILKVAGLATLSLVAGVQGVFYFVIVGMKSWTKSYYFPGLGFTPPGGSPKRVGKYTFAAHFQPLSERVFGSIQIKDYFR